MSRSSVNRRLNVLVGSTLGGVAGSTSGSASISSTTVSETRSKQSWTSSYLSMGKEDRSVIADRTVMNRLYAADVRRLR
jgi:hypothetical protein